MYCVNTPGSVDTIDERRSKIVRNSFRLPFVAQLATNGYQKHIFRDILIHVRRLLRAFVIAAYKVWFMGQQNLLRKCAHATHVLTQKHIEWKQNIRK